MAKPVPEPDQALLDDLVVANGVLYHKSIVDGLGHVSVRHDKDPQMYVLAAARGSCGLRSRQQCAHLARAAPLQRALYSWRDLQGAPGCALGRALPHAGAGDVLRLPDPVAPALSHERVSRARGRALRDPGSG